MSELSEKQKRFCVEYLKDLNGTAAAIRAGYSANSASVQASRLLANAKIKAYINKLKRSRSERTKVDSDWLLIRLADEADADMADLYDETGMLKPVREWPRIWRTGLVDGLETLEQRDETGQVIGYIRKVKLSKRSTRLDMIGKHIDVGAWRNNVDLTNSDGTMTPPTVIEIKGVEPSDQSPDDSGADE